MLSIGERPQSLAGARRGKAAPEALSRGPSVQPAPSTARRKARCVCERERRSGGAEGPARRPARTFPLADRGDVVVRDGHGVSLLLSFLSFIPVMPPLPTALVIACFVGVFPAMGSARLGARRRGVPLSGPEFIRGLPPGSGWSRPSRSCRSSVRNQGCPDRRRFTTVSTTSITTGALSPQQWLGTNADCGRSSGSSRPSPPSSTRWSSRSTGSAADRLSPADGKWLIPCSGAKPHSPRRAKPERGPGRAICLHACSPRPEDAEVAHPETGESAFARPDALGKI